jgi:hypothetical protein
MVTLLRVQSSIMTRSSEEPKGLYEAVSRIPNMESSASAAEMRGLLSEYVGGHYLRGDAV